MQDSKTAGESFQAKWEKAALSLHGEGDGGASAEHGASQVLPAVPRQSAKRSR